MQKRFQDSIWKQQVACDVTMPFMNKEKTQKYKRDLKLIPNSFYPKTPDCFMSHIFAHKRKTSVQFIEDWICGYIFCTNYLQRPFCAEADLFPGVFIL